MSRCTHRVVKIQAATVQERFRLIVDAAKASGLVLDGEFIYWRNTD